jgi:hypothetical protein
VRFGAIKLTLTTHILLPQPQAERVFGFALSLAELALVERLSSQADFDDAVIRAGAP